MSRRISSFFGLTKSPDSGSLDSSVHSTLTDLSSLNLSSDASFRRRGSISMNMGFSDQVEDDIDGIMGNLYLDPDVLEKKCILSMKGTFELESTSKTSHVLDKFGNQVRVMDEDARKAQDLEPSYFTPDFDPVQGYVQQVSDMEPSELNEYFMDKILEIDEDKDMVIAELSDMIEASYNELMDCVRNVNDVDLDLSRALIQIEESRGSIKRGSVILNKGNMKICTLKKRYENISILKDAAKSLKYTKDIFKAMNLNITTGDLGRAAEYLRIVLKGTNRQEYKRFKALMNVQEESKKSLSIIRQKADKALQRLCCRKFAASEYSNIIRAYLVLDDLHMNVLHDTSPSDQLQCVESLPYKIQQYHNDDIDNCLHTAILEFIMASQYKKQKAAAEVGSYAGSNSSEMMDVAELPLYMLYQRIGAESIAYSIMRSCELFAESIYTHYMISQWHEKAEGIGFLDEDDSDFMWDNADITALRNISSKIRDSRVVLWEDMLRGLVEMLGSVSITAVVSLDDFLAVVWAIECMVTLGHEFSGSNSIQLLSLIDNKSKEYVQYVHIDAFHILQQLLDADPWENVPIKLSDYGGVLGILKSKVQAPRNERSLFKAVLRAEENGLPGASKLGFISSSPSSSIPSSTSSSGNNLLSDMNDSADKTSSSTILSSFQAHGNPFHFMTEDDEDSSSTIRPKQSFVDEISNVMSRILTDDMDLDNINNHSNKKLTPSSSSRRNQQINDTLVVTQSVLNGLSRFTGSYLQMMHMMPRSAFDIWLKFCELYDYYICYIFNAFLSTEDKNRFMGKPSKMSIPAPDQIKDFEALYKFLDKSMNKDIYRPSTNTSSSGANSASIDSENTTSSNHSGSDNNLSYRAMNGEKVKLSSLLTIPAVLDTNNDNDMMRELTYRVVASESCWFAARILNEIKDKLSILLRNCESACDIYISQYQLISSQLRSLIYKSTCPQLIKSSWILSQIEAGTWESKKLRDSHHDWVNTVIKTSHELWDYFCNGIGFSDSTPFIKEQLWLELCQSIFDTVLDGFAKIRKLSNEGRALMTMDISALHDGLDNIHPCRPPRGKQHISNFIRGTYLSDEDSLAWVEENWQSFSYRQVHGLLTLNLASVLNSRKLKDALLMLDGLYFNQVNDWQIPRYADLFDMRAKEEVGTLKSISNLSHRLMRSPQPDK